MKPVDKKLFPEFNKSERKNIAILEERRQYLTNRIEGGTCSENARSYIKDERDALDWIIQKVTKETA